MSTFAYMQCKGARQGVHQNRRNSDMPTIDALPQVTEIHTNCPLCETALDPTNPTECPKCDWVVGYRRQQAQRVGTIRDNIALLLSVVPGAGHLYKGHRMLGVIFMAGTLVAI